MQMCIWVGKGDAPISFYEEGGDVPLISDPRFRDKHQGVPAIFTKESELEFAKYVMANRKAMQLRKANVEGEGKGKGKEKEE